MRRVIGWASAFVVAVALASCSGAEMRSGLPCERCTYGVAKDGKAKPPVWRCVVDGKEIDCAKDPSGCPTCAKMTK